MSQCHKFVQTLFLPLHLASNVILPPLFLRPQLSRTSPGGSFEARPGDPLYVSSSHLWGGGDQRVPRPRDARAPVGRRKSVRPVAERGTFPSPRPSMEWFQTTRPVWTVPSCGRWGSEMTPFWDVMRGGIDLADLVAVASCC